MVLAASTRFGGEMPIREEPRDQRGSVSDGYRHSWITDLENIQPSLRESNLPAPSNLGILTTPETFDEPPQGASATSQDVENAIDFLRELDADGWHSLWALHPETGKRIGRTFKPESWEAMRDWIAARISEWNLYYSVNEPKPDAPHKKLAKDNIGRLRVVQVDIDPDEDKTAPRGLATERKRIKALLRGVDPLHQPTFVIDSGNGFQALWQLSDKLDAAESREAIENQNRGLVKKFGGDPASIDISRVLRLPGTINYPNAKKKALGRKAVATAMIEDTGERYRLQDVAELAKPVAAGGKKPGSDLDAEINALAAKIDMDAVQGGPSAELHTRFEAHRKANPTLDLLWQGDKSALRGDDATGSGFTFSLAIYLKRAGGFTFTEFGQLLQIWDYASEPEKIDARRIARDWIRGSSWTRTAPEDEFEPVDNIVDRRMPDDPTDLWDERRLREPKTLPIGCVPPFIEDFAKDKSNRLGAEWSAVAVACIAGAGGVVPAGNVIHLHEKSKDWPLHPILWTAIVGDSGSGKSPIHDVGMIFVNTVEKSWAAEYAKAIDLYNLTSPTKKSSRKRYADCADDMCTDAAFRKEPTRRRKKTTDATPEAMVTLLRDNPAGMIYSSDELAAWSGGMDAYRTRGGKDRPFWLDMKKGAPIAVHRKSGSIDAPFGAVSVFGTIQPDPLKEILRKTGDGLLQRFMFAFARRLHDPRDLPADDTLNDKAVHLALALASADNDREYRLTLDARRELDAIHAFKNREIARLDNPPHLGEWIDKQPSEFGRLSLIFHFIEWASGIGPSIENNPPERISLATATRARRFIEEFLYPNARLVFGETSKNADHAIKAAGYILAHKSAKVTERELKRGPLKNHPEDQVRAAMRILETEGWVTPSSARLPKWDVNAVVNDGRFHEIAERERQRRAEIAKKIEDAADARL